MHSCRLWHKWEATDYRIQSLRRLFNQEIHHKFLLGLESWEWKNVNVPMIGEIERERGTEVEEC